MPKKQFDAILAKNSIARELKDYIQRKEPLNVSFIIYNLNEIEIFTGEGNQPSVDSILNTTTDI